MAQLTRKFFFLARNPFHVARRPEKNHCLLFPFSFRSSSRSPSPVVFRTLHRHICRIPHSIVDNTILFFPTIFHTPAQSPYRKFINFFFQLGRRLFVVTPTALICKTACSRFIRRCVEIQLSSCPITRRLEMIPRGRNSRPNGVFSRADGPGTRFVVIDRRPGGKAEFADRRKRRVPGKPRGVGVGVSAGRRGGGSKRMAGGVGTWERGAPPSNVRELAEFSH